MVPMLDGNAEHVSPVQKKTILRVAAKKFCFSGLATKALFPPPLELSGHRFFEICLFYSGPAITSPILLVAGLLKKTGRFTDFTLHVRTYI